METYPISVAAARLGAARLGVEATRSPWATLAVVGAEHARTTGAAAAAGRPEARPAASRQLPVQAQHPVQTQDSGLMSAEALPSVNDTRKPKNVHKTRVNAGGYGAMGPHPEREQPA